MAETSPKQPAASEFKVYGWDSLGSDLVKIHPGQATGYKALDRYVKIPRGAITIIAARPSNCKTSFQLNLLLNMLRNPANKDSKFVFFSYEEAKKYLATKFIMIMAGEVLHDSENLAAYLNYLKSYYNGKLKRIKGEIKRALEEFKFHTDESQRLLIIDKPYKGEDLADLIGKFGQDSQIGAVFIDYIQKVPIGSSFTQNTRYLELKRVSELLLENAKSQDIPIIVGAQIGRSGADEGRLTLHSIRESGDLEQDANVVLGLKKISMDNKEHSNNVSGPVNLDVYILKNRGGPQGGTVSLDFDGRIFQISERMGFF